MELDQEEIYMELYSNALDRGEAELKDVLADKYIFNNHMLCPVDDLIFNEDEVELLESNRKSLESYPIWDFIIKKNG